MKNKSDNVIILTEKDIRRAKYSNHKKGGDLAIYLRNRFYEKVKDSSKAYTRKHRRENKQQIIKLKDIQEEDYYELDNEPA